MRNALIALAFMTLPMPAFAANQTAAPVAMPAVGRFEDEGIASSKPVLANTGSASLAIGQEAPNFSATDAYGKQFKLSNYLGKIIVLEWTNPECPFVQWHYGSSNMQNLQAEARSKGIVWISINSSAPKREGNLTPEEAQKYIKDMKMQSDRYVLDSEGTIGRLYGAKTTPHMFIINEDGNIAYMGAIDDQPTPAPRDNAKSVNYVRNALSDLIEGQPIKTPSTQAYGCSVKYAKKE